MRVVTTASWHGLEEYGYRWLNSLKHWPADTEFVWYTEKYLLPVQEYCNRPVATKDFAELREFSEWKLRHAFYVPPSWRWDVIRYSHKVFAACDALADYDGVGVWLDADCVTFKDIPDGYIESLVGEDYIAHFGRTGHYTETGFWAVNCAHECHKDFLRHWQQIYYAGRYRQLHEWHDCTTLDAVIRKFVQDGRITARNLSGEHAMDMHPQALSELGQYIDHCKGPRKVKGYSKENKNRREAA